LLFIDKTAQRSFNLLIISRMGQCLAEEENVVDLCMLNKIKYKCNAMLKPLRNKVKSKKSQ
jgi:hypothetical protein